MKRLILLTVALISMLLATQAATISFSTPNKPATWARMPNGMNTYVTEDGRGISGGQRQRILLARALVRCPDIMLLDEVTSALDNVTQQRVADYLASMKCTRITIAHRLETIRQCDRIIVLGNGRVVKEGTYDELIAAGVLQKG